MPDTDTASPVDTQLLTHRAVRSAGQSPGRSWRDVLPIHPAADLFPLMAETDPIALKELADDIQKNGLQVPITIMNYRAGDSGECLYQLLDGRNRLDAIELAGFNPIAPERRYHVERRDCGLDLFLGLPDSNIAINYIDPPDDPYAFVASVNIHRRHLTAEQKRDLIAKLLKVQPEKSNLQVAKQAKANDKTVAKVRRELEGRSEIPNVLTRTDTKGRKQSARKAAAPAAVIEQRRQTRVAKQEQANARARACREREEIHADISRFACKLVRLDIEIARELHRVLVECGGDAIQLMDDLAAGIEIEEAGKFNKGGPDGNDADPDASAEAVKATFAAIDDGLDIPACLRRTP